MAKTVFILLDGCNYRTATENLGYLEHLTEAGAIAKHRVRGELPASSRPMYETLLTGLPVLEHGVASNLAVRLSRCENIFSLCRKNGLSTAAAAYCWISELYVRAPFSHKTDRFLNDPDCAIQHGVFYFEDNYPDSHVLADATYLLQRHGPDFLMIHTMNIDDAGHAFTCASPQYAKAAAKADMLLSVLVPELTEAGCSVVVTADHGMNGLGLHGGNTDEQRETALYLFSPSARRGDFTRNAIPQLCVAPLLCACLDMERAPGMRSLQELEVPFFEG
ncbi:MAG TPA: alkaline phosphatase family protein [Feifaniaceae bacterium]|nr:alkaline phosphatase family protein [Feifaniaceae bacterium]